jgi:hypothetical protein
MTQSAHTQTVQVKLETSSSSVLSPYNAAALEWGGGGLLRAGLDSNHPPQMLDPRRATSYSPRKARVCSPNRRNFVLVPWNLPATNALARSALHRREHYIRSS